MKIKNGRQNANAFKQDEFLNPSFYSQSLLNVTSFKIEVDKATLRRFSMNGKSWRPEKRAWT